MKAWKIFRRWDAQIVSMAAMGELQKVYTPQAGLEEQGEAMFFWTDETMARHCIGDHEGYTLWEVEIPDNAWYAVPGGYALGWALSGEAMLEYTLEYWRDHITALLPDIQPTIRDLWRAWQVGMLSRTLHKDFISTRGYMRQELALSILHMVNPEVVLCDRFTYQTCLLPFGHRPTQFTEA